MNVVFRAPFGPTRPSISPERTSRSRPSSARSRPKDRTTPWATIALPSSIDPILIGVEEGPKGRATRGEGGGRRGARGALDRGGVDGARHLEVLRASQRNPHRERAADPRRALHLDAPADRLEQAGDDVQAQSHAAV